MFKRLWNKIKPKPRCKRELMGYRCHSHYPDGCETCGRGKKNGLDKQ